MKWLFLLGLCSQGLLLARERPTTLQALLIRDTSVPDAKIASQADTKRMKQLLEIIGHQTNLRVKITTLDINCLGPTTFDAWLSSIQKNKTIAFLYYSGRPRTSAVPSSWPSITYHGCRCREGHPLSQDEFANRIQEYKPRLSFVIFDCYTRSVSHNDHVSLPRPVTIKTKSKLANIKRLFLRHTGLIMATSVPVRDLRLCSTKQKPIGGVFTTSFLRGFLHVARSFRLGWSNITHVMYGCAPSCSQDVRKCFAFNIKSEVPCVYYKGQ